MKLFGFDIKLAGNKPKETETESKEFQGFRSVMFISEAGRILLL